jgi:Cu(I)/Ag(I) efflux system periplasmic protein CusF
VGATVIFGVLKMKKSLFALLCALVLAFQMPAMAHDGKHDESAHVHRHSTGWVHGEVIKIDKPRKHITIKHDAIESIAMEAMTMPFKVNRPALLNKVKVGNHVKFELEVLNDELSLIGMEVVK